MSLPSIAEFYNSDIDFLGTTYINCGWYVDGRAIWDCLWRLANEKEIPFGTQYIELYGRVIDIMKFGEIKTKDEQIEYLDKLYSLKLPKSS